MATTIDLDTGKITKSIAERKLALNQGPSTPVKLYTDVNIPGKVGRFLPNSGAARPTGKTRPKKGRV